MPRLEQRVSHVEGQVSELSLRLSGVEAAIRHLEQRTDARFDALDAKMSRQFMWLVGIQVTTLVAVVTALTAVVAALISRG
jgi:hypothetical protein